MSIDDLYIQTKKQLDQQLPFVIYKKPAYNRVKALLQTDDEYYQAHTFLESGFVFAPFDHRLEKGLIPLEKSTPYSVDFLGAAKKEETIKGQQKSPEYPVIPFSIKDTHTQLVQKGIEKIASGTLKKVVLSRKEEVKTPNTNNPIKLFDTLIHKYQNAFVYLWYHPKIGMWLGATPETLLKIEDNNFSTMSLAGTQPYVDTIHVDWGNKELVEQKMVTSFIGDQLSEIVDDIQYSETYTHKAGNLLHLRTDINGVLKSNGTDLQNIISSLHPTPAVCGLPKEDAKSFILDYETYDRKYYTGFMGELNIKKENKKISELFVNLRCMEIIDDTAVLFVGGGITIDSDPAQEWEETVRKTETMKRVLL